MVPGTTGTMYPSGGLRDYAVNQDIEWANFAALLSMGIISEIKTTLIECSPCELLRYLPCIGWL